MKHLSTVYLVIAAAFAAPVPGIAQAAPTGTVEMVLTDRSAQLMDQAFFESLYTYRDYAPLWSDPAQLRAFEALAKDSWMEGLTLADYVSASRPKLGRSWGCPSLSRRNSTHPHCMAESLRQHTVSLIALSGCYL